MCSWDPFQRSETSEKDTPNQSSIYSIYCPQYSPDFVCVFWGSFSKRLSNFLKDNSWLGHGTDDRNNLDTSNINQTILPRHPNTSWEGLFGVIWGVQTPSQQVFWEGVWLWGSVGSVLQMECESSPRIVASSNPTGFDGTWNPRGSSEHPKFYDGFFLHQKTVWNWQFFKVWL